jgi:hypothetical protein
MADIKLGANGYSEVPNYTFLLTVYIYLSANTFNITLLMIFRDRLNSNRHLDRHDVLWSLAHIT